MKCRKKYKRILALGIALLALLAFAGCQLAKEEGGETESAERDRLIGVFLTENIWTSCSIGKDMSKTI